MKGIVNAIRLRMDWRPLAGLTPEDAGGLVERVIARVALDRAVAQHNEDCEKAKRG